MTIEQYLEGLDEADKVLWRRMLDRIPFLVVHGAYHKTPDTSADFITVFTNLWGSLSSDKISTALGLTSEADLANVYQDDTDDEDEEDDNTVMCARCEDSVPDDEVTEVVVNHSWRLRQNGTNVETWCNSCADRHTTTCRDCDLVTSDALIIDSDLCQNCYEDHYFRCPDCGEITHNDDGYVVEDDDTYCQSCGPSRDGGGLIHEYSHKPSPIFHGGAGICHYGIELELSCALDEAENVMDACGGDRYAYLKKDSSIAGGGFELVSHPMTLGFHSSHWDKLFNYIARANTPRYGKITASENGMHVHIQRQYLTQLQICMMDYFVNRFEAFTEFIADRDTTEWAACDSRKKLTRYNASPERYTALNRAPSKTVELRIFRGTTNRSMFLANIEFADALRTFCKDRSLTGVTVEAFCAHVRANRKIYLHLEERLTRAGYLPARKERKQTACA